MTPQDTVRNTMLEQLFEELSTALEKAVWRWNENQHPSRMLGIGHERSLGSQPSSRRLLISHAGREPEVAIFLGQESMMVTYLYRRGFELRYGLREDSQAGCLLMDGIRMTVTDASRKILAPVFERFGNHAT